MSETTKALANEAKQQAVAAGKQAAQQAAEKALEKQEEKVKKTAQKVQQAAQYAQQGMQYAQMAQSILGAGNNGTAAGGAGTTPPTQNTTQDAGSSTTAAAMAAADVAGIIHVVALNIVIDGEVFEHFESFTLNQSATGHHGFTLVLQHDVTGKAQDYKMEDARNFLGKRISVTFKYKNILSGSPERNFIGIISNVGFRQEHGSKGNIVLTGQSPTILLDAANHTQSFGGASGTNLDVVAKEVIKQALGGSKFDVTVKCVNKTDLSYTCQYDETHYNYLARMAAAYGEWFFYDGTVLYFGKPSQADPIKLIYGKDTHQVELQMKAKYVNDQHYGYNSSEDKPLSTGETKAKGLGELGSYAYDESSKIFGGPSLAVAPIRAKTDNDIKNTQQGAIGATAATIFTLSGITSVPFLYPGCLVEMNFRKEDSSEISYFSRLLVLSIQHSVDELGHYNGYFEAIPSDTEYLPAVPYIMPVAQTQLATVKNNKDDQGRVRVQFDWQAGSDTTDLIRVSTINAGKSDDVNTNRGLVFIPEVDDQVMVGFVHNHPDRPYVLASMFTGKTGTGGGDNNKTKSIITRSKVSITFDDEKGSLTLTDKGKESISLDGAGNISISAASSISLSCGKASITLKSDGTITIDGKTVSTTGSASASMTSGPASFSATSEGGVADMTGTDSTVTGKTSATLTSDVETSVSGTAKTSISSGGPTSIEGAIVKLN